MRAAALLAVPATAWLAACGGSGAGAEVEAAGARATIATGLQVPWGIAFLPNRDALVAERTTGRIIRIKKRSHRRSVVMNVPGVDTGAGEGGLLGLAVSPRYRRDRLVYAYFTSAGDNRIVRFKLGGSVRPVVTGIARGLIHDGGRIAFGPDGKLYAGVGETGEGNLAQDKSSQNGKILRMNPDGSVPADNPFPRSRVWSLGHRNVQGLAWDRAHRLWATEFGQDKFDEVNHIRKGRNYGWPVVEGKGDTRGGRFTNPLVTWSTDEASPSGAAIVRGNLYVGALQCKCVWRVPLHGAKTGKPRKMLTGYGRIRTVVRAPDGALWIATSNRDGRGSPGDGDDRIVRVTLRR